MQDNYIDVSVTDLRDTRWIGGLSKVVILSHVCQSAPKIVVLVTLIQGPSGSRVVSYPVTCKQLKQTNSG